jgi:hypothetical protein
MNRLLLTKLQLKAGGSHYPSINPQMQDSFAKLILEECVGIIENNKTYAKDKKWTTSELADVCVYEIRNTFGVEE